MTTLRHCVECGEQTPNLSLVCDACAPLYHDLRAAASINTPLVDDTCPCPACRSDLAAITPCLRVVK